MRYLEPVVVSGGHGGGPYAYGLAFRSRALLGGVGTTRRSRGAGAIWHQLEIADFRIALQKEFESHNGELVEWLGESVLRGLLIGRRGTPVPDALIHWRLRGREGTLLLEWDRGSESLAVLTAKIRTYVDHWRVRAHRELIPGLGLKPRLAVVLDSRERASRLTRWLTEKQAETLPATVLIGVAKSVLVDPLGDLWWRSDSGRAGSFHR